MIPVSLIPALISAGLEIFQLIKEIRDESGRKGEWTLDQEAQFDALRKAAYESPHWKPRGELP